MQSVKASGPLGFVFVVCLFVCFLGLISKYGSIAKVTQIITSQQVRFKI